MTVTTISYFRFGPISDRLWMFAQMGLARRALARVSDIGFWKLFGTGIGQGFTPLPNTGLYAVLATWPDLDTAREQTRNASVFKRFSQRARETFTVYLEPVSVRGRWSGHRPFTPIAEPDALPRPLAVLTRATIKPRRALQFWRRAPAVSDTIGDNDDVVFKAGMGEVPGLQQVTFSIWPDMGTMSRFAYRSAAHAQAIRAVRDGNVFSEELYARFAILATEGSWEGGDPVSSHLIASAQSAEALSPPSPRTREGA